MERAGVIVRQTSERRSYVTRQIADETLIVPVTGHVMNLESIYVLNPVASRIWELLQSPTTADQISGVVADEFAVSQERAAADVREFLDVLAARGLVGAAAEGV